MCFRRTASGSTSVSASRANGRAVEIIGNVSVHAERVEAFLGFFSRIMIVSTNAQGFSTRAALCRGAAFFALWVVLIGTSSSDLIAGVLAAVAAAWTSLGLLPPGFHQRVRLIGVLPLIPHFLWK